MPHNFEDQYFMRAALKQAKSALERGEVPVGAVLVTQNIIIAKAHNTTELLNDVTAHAEMLTITSGANYLGAKYLNDCTLYVTLEPCLMCAGAIAWSQLGRLVFGASDERRGFMRIGKSVLHPKTELALGVLEEECRVIMQDFFKARR